MFEDLLSPNEAARILGVTEAALSRFRFEHRGPAFVRVGKLVRYSKQDLLNWIDVQTVRHETGPEPVEVGR